jgi:hypothetical protein
MGKKRTYKRTIRYVLYLSLCKIQYRVRMVFDAPFNNIVLLVKETGVPGENHLPAASH